MPTVVIENPILNSPYEEPRRHFKFSDDGITDEIVEARRVSSYFVPIPRPKNAAKGQISLGPEWTQDRVKENEFINRVRGEVNKWRLGGYQGITSLTRRLLEYWLNPERERRLFFCQIEAAETAIFLNEVANKYGVNWIDNQLRAAKDEANPLLYRVALKMATGSGKTVVMAMLIAWQALNKFANPQDSRFSDSFLIVTPGITIKDRLRVLLPNDPNNYYRQLDVLPPDLLTDLERAKIVIENFHTLKTRETIQASRTTKAILRAGSDESQPSPFTETPDQMVRRVCRSLGSKRSIVVINDEAHHCYRRKVGGDDAPLAGDDKKEAEQRNEEARVWISGLEAVQRKIGVKAVYDLSATPFFLRGSGYTEGDLFPWVVADFSLIDAIESGIVKIPRVPIADNAMQGPQPTYRDLWQRIRLDLPRKGRKTLAAEGEPQLPAELEGALQSLYSNYKQYEEQWEQNAEAWANGLTPPVFIVVCNNTNVSKLVFDYISGWEKVLDDGRTKILVPGELPLFSNVTDGNRWSDRPSTILVDSSQLESGEAMSAEFKKIAAAEIAEFKAEYRARTGGDPEEVTDQDLLREVMNTVGKLGKLGENVKCVVSVSMLTEGWDANTVTHILGVRAFGTQLLCEQVIGRGLRRVSYATNEGGMFDPEYAEVYGVPFSFIPCSGSRKEVKSGPAPHRVRALEDRIASEITFPRVVGYRYDFPEERLRWRFTDESRVVLSTADLPTDTELSGIVGAIAHHTLDDLRREREQTVAFALAKLALERYFSDAGDRHPWLFPRLLAMSREWLAGYLVCKDDTFPQLLLLSERKHDAADRLYRAAVREQDGEKRLKPILRAYDPVGSTRYVDFDTTRQVYPTRPDKCHVSHVALDTTSWEQKLAQSLEDMPEVLAYVKNQSLGFTIPYVLDGREHDYLPDFLVRYNDGRSDPLNLILEVTGEKKKDKAVKVATATTLWVPAINNHGGFGRWAFLEIDDPWNAKNTIRSAVASLQTQEVAV